MAFAADKVIGDALLTKGYTAGENLESNRFVKVDTTDDTKVVYADAGDPAIGVNRDKVNSGQPADIILIGRWPVTTSENVTANDLVSADADGKAQVAASTEDVLGKAAKNANVGDPVMVILGVGGAF